MIGWIVLATYVVGFLVTLRLSARRSYNTDAVDEFALAFIWPIVAVILASLGLAWCVYRVATMDLPKPRNPFRRKVKDGDPQRIAELEYDLGITDVPPPFRVNGPIVGNVNHPGRTDHRSCCGVLTSHAMSCRQLAALQEGKLRQVGDHDYEVIQ